MSHDDSIYKRENLTEEELRHLPGRSNINNRVTYEYWNRRYGITINDILKNTNITYEDYLDPSRWTNVLDTYTSDLNFFRYSNGAMLPRDSYSAGLETRFVNSPVVVGFYRMLPIQSMLNGIIRENYKFNREYIIESREIGTNHFHLFFTPYAYKRIYSVGQECHFVNGVIDSNYLLHQVKEFTTRHLFCSQRIQNILKSLEVQGLVHWEEDRREIRVDEKLIALQLPLSEALKKNGIENVGVDEGTDVYYVVESLLIQDRVALYRGEIYNAPYCLVDTAWKSGGNKVISQLKSLAYFLRSFAGSNGIAERALQEREHAALQALEAKTAALEISKKSEENKKKLLLRLGHEVKNPLHGTMNLLHLAREHTNSAESVHFLSLASNTLERLSRLVETILNSTSEEKDIQLKNPTSFDLIPVIQSAIDHYSLLGNEEKLNYNLDSHNASIWVYGEADKVSQIMFNLLSNAAKHTEHGSIIVTVEETNEIIVSVRDTGVGIDPNKLNRVFETYFQVENYEDGLGIGLSVVKMLVKAHNGRVWIHSESNRGTSVFFTLPKGDPIEEDPNENVDSSEKIHSVWYVEDELTNRIVLQKALENFCLEVKGFSNGRDCLKSIQIAHPDILLVDLMIPNMDGFSLIEKVRMIWDTSLLSICVLSARGSREEVQRAIESGADEYLGKPILPFDLEVRLKKLLKVRKKGKYGVLIEQRAEDVGLSIREIECVNLVCRGCSNLEIAESLTISEATVKRHLYNIYNKAGCNSRTELIRFFTG